MSHVWFVSYGSNMSAARLACYLEGRRHDDVPLLTFTSPHGAAHVPHARPSAADLSMLAAGLRESRAWDDDRVAAYLESVIPAAADFP